MIFKEPSYRCLWKTVVDNALRAVCFKMVSVNTNKCSIIGRSATSIKAQNNELKNVKHNCFPAGLLRAFNLHIMNLQEDIQWK